MGDTDGLDLSSLTQGTKFWIPDSKNLWVGAVVFTPPTNKSVTVKTDDGQFLVITSLGAKGIEIATEDGEHSEKHKVTVLPPKNPEFLEGCPDLTTLSYLHEPAVLHNLRLRYMRDEIYTFTGAILIALNPWKQLPALYSEDIMRSYAESSPDGPDPAPHVYYVANTAYRAMTETSTNQTILVSGESGAGKTENCKIIMRFLAMSTGDYTNVGEIERRVLDSNPILEAFGNARTLRNDNSSRFGKFTEIHFNDHGRITGAKIETYLLEKSRLTRLGPGDRNFHILYQLCAGVDGELRAALRLGTAQSYHYLNQSDVFTIDGLADADEFAVTRRAMSTMGITDREQEGVFRVVAAILHLGNVTFSATDRDAAQIAGESTAALGVTADLLRLDADALTMALCGRRIFAGGEYLQQALRVDQAVDARDALAKALYSKLFNWLVVRINSSICKPDAVRFIGILDIFGFEYFEENSFEQLCINYANEKIQQLFNTHIFKMEQKEYAKEQIKWTYVEFKDNQAVLDLIEDKPGGLLAVLDEECMMPKGTDSGFVQKLFSRVTNDHLVKNKFSEDGFIIRHFAGEVTYDGYQFLHKNKDALHPDLVPCVQASKDPFVKTLFPASLFHREAIKSKSKDKAAPESSKIFQVTVGTQFKEALKELASKIWTTTPYFVRCIKPNGIKKPRVFDLRDVAVQLHCGGVFEAIRIMRDMYPSRISHEEFYRRFTTREWRCIMARGKAASHFTPLPGNNFDDFEALRLCCVGLCQALELGQDRFQVGRSKVFFRTGILAQQEDRLQRYLFASASRIRARYLGWVRRREYLRVRGAALIIAKYVRRFLAVRRFARARRERAAAVIQRAWRKFSRVSGFRKVVYMVTKKMFLEKRAIEIEKRREEAATAIQAAFRRHWARRRFVVAKGGVTKVQAAWRGKKVRATIKINRAVNIVEEKKRLDEEVKQLRARVAALESDLGGANARIASLDERNNELSGSLVATTDQLSATKGAKKKLEEKMAAQLADLQETRAKLEVEAEQSASLKAQLASLSSEHASVSATARQLADDKARLSQEAESLSHQSAADTARFTKEIAFLKAELEHEQQEKQSMTKTLKAEKGTKESLGEVIMAIKRGLHRLARQAKHMRESAALEASSMRAALERDLLVQIAPLRMAMAEAWKTSEALRDEKAALEDDMAEMEKRLESAIEDLMRTERELSEETEAHWRTMDQKKTLEKQAQTGAQLFSALESRKSFLEAEVAERNKEIAALKAAVTRQQAKSPAGGAAGAAGAAAGASSSLSAPRYSLAEMAGLPGLIASRRQQQAQSIVSRVKSAPEAASEVSRVTRTGWLTKDRKKSEKDARKSKWERRYFVLRSTEVVYYEDAEMKKVKGNIPLDVCFVTQEIGHQMEGVANGEPCLKLITGGRTLYFFADTADETRAWVSAMKTNIAFNSYLKKAIATKSRIDSRVGETTQTYQTATALLFEHEPLALEAVVALAQPIADAKLCTTLSFEGAGLTDLHIQVLAEALGAQPAMRTLNLSKNVIGDVGIKQLAAALAKNSVLDTLILSENGFRADGAAALAELLRANTRLARLLVDGNEIGDHGVAALCAALSAKKDGSAARRFPAINFSGTGMGDGGAEAIAALLAANPTVVDVFLSHNRIEQKGAQSIARSLEKNRSVQCLDVSYNAIDGEGAMALARMLEVNSQMLSLSIGGNKLTSGKELSTVISTVAADSKLVFPMLAFERQATG